MTNPFAVSRDIAEAICYNGITSLIIVLIEDLLEDEDTTLEEKTDSIAELVGALNKNKELIKKVLIENGYE